MQGVGDRPAKHLAQSLSPDGIQLFPAGTRFNIIESGLRPFESHSRT
jgi:hypothetical protein